MFKQKKSSNLLRFLFFFLLRVEAPRFKKADQINKTPIILMSHLGKTILWSVWEEVRYFD